MPSGNFLSCGYVNAVCKLANFLLSPSGWITNSWETRRDTRLLREQCYVLIQRDRIYSIKRRSRINATFGKKKFRNAAVTRGIHRKGNASFTIGYFEETRLKPFEMCTINCRRDPPFHNAVTKPPVNNAIEKCSKGWLSLVTESQSESWAKS